MKSFAANHKGFSLIELMVAMAVASVLMAGIFTFHQSQVKSNVTQQELVNMQQDARVAMYLMTSEIRMAGCDPQNSTGATIRTAGVATIAFDSDQNGDGAIDASTERFYYALSNDADNDGVADGTPCNLNRGDWNTPAAPVPGTLNPVALNIDALNFVYFDGAGNVLDDDGNGNVTTNIAAIRSVQISLVARSGDQLPGGMYRRTDSTTYTNPQGTVILDAPNDDFRRIQLTAAVRVRNMGL